MKVLYWNKSSTAWAYSWQRKSHSRYQDVLAAPSITENRPIS